MKTTKKFHKRRRSAAAGFTLIELLVVISLVAILTTLATPSLRDLIQRTRIATEVNSLVSDLQFARSEAIKRGLPVSVCASSDGSTCLTANTWNQGWIVFSDADGSATVNGTDAVLRIRKGWTSGDTFVASPSQVAVTFSRDGFATNVPGTVTIALRTSPINSNATRCLMLNRVGRQAVQSPGVGACT